MVLDTFPIFNELDLLELRLNILSPVVDRFIITEARETFTGKKKPLYFQENASRFEMWLHKIDCYVIDDFPSDTELYEQAMASPNTGNKEHWWLREFYQKESAMRALELAAKDDDIVCVSDLDEIWNPKLPIRDWDYSNGQVYRPKMDAYHYFLNNRSNQDINGWVGTRIGQFKTVKQQGINHFRTESFTPSQLVENGGWHFTNIGSAEVIKEKLEAYSHQEYNQVGIKEMIASNIHNNQDFLGRGFKLWLDESAWPEYLKNNRDEYAHLLK